MISVGVQLYTVRSLMTTPEQSREAQELGITRFVVEQDKCPGDPLESLRQSVDNLKKLF